MNRQYTAANGRTINITRLQIAGYGRPPRWRAEDARWPSIDPVEFSAFDKGNFNIERIAAHLLDESERKCAQGTD